jgi:hypothetical protein
MQKAPVNFRVFWGFSDTAGLGLFSLLFSLWDFLKSKKSQNSWYYWSKVMLVARTGIEPVFQP